MSLYDIYRSVTDPNYPKVLAAIEYSKRIQTKCNCTFDKEYAPKDISMWDSHKLSDEVDKIYEQLGIPRTR